MAIKKVANELKDINDKSRKEDISNFLSNNPGCSKEELVRGVKHTVSKKTVIKILKELEKEEQIKIEKETPNSRAYKLFLCSKNIIIMEDKRISDINEEFIILIKKIEAVIPDVI